MKDLKQHCMVIGFGFVAKNWFQKMSDYSWNFKHKFKNINKAEISITENWQLNGYNNFSLFIGVTLESI